MNFLMKFRIVFLLALIECGYFIISRHISERLPWDSVNAEIIKSMLRLGTAYLDWVLMKGLVLSRQSSLDRTNYPWTFVAGAAVFFMVPVVMGDYGLSTPKNFFFAFTSLFVAIKEELLFRGILINFLERRIGIFYSVVLSSLVFAIWHIGVVNPDFWNFIQILMAGLFLGVIYVGTGSIIMVIAFHAIYDAIFCFSPFFDLNDRVLPGILLLMLASLFMVSWVRSIKSEGRA